MWLIYRDRLVSVYPVCPPIELKLRHTHSIDDWFRSLHRVIGLDLGIIDWAVDMDHPQISVLLHWELAAGALRRVDPVYNSSIQKFG